MRFELKPALLRVVFFTALLGLLQPWAADGSPANETASESEVDRGHWHLERAIRAIGPIGRFDEIEAVRFRGLSADGAGDETLVDMWMVYPQDAPGELDSGLWMRILSGPSDNLGFERRVAGEESWAKGVGALPAELHWDAVRYASTKLLTLMKHRHDSSTRVRYTGTETVDGTPVDVVEVSLRGHTSWLEIDPDGRVLAVRFYSSPIQEEVEGELVRRSYGDYREVEGFTLPFHQSVTVGGEDYNQWQLETLEVGPKIDWDWFEAFPTPDD